MKIIKRFLLKGILFLFMMFVLLSILLVLPFKWLNPPISMVMIEKYLSSSVDHYSIEYEWVNWDDIVPSIAMAVITAEDQRFLEHSGVDMNAIFTAIEAKFEGKPLRGASTITQQVAKNMFLWTGRSWVRKGFELWFSVLIELLWSKQRTLEIYLNIAEWGEGVFGVQKASQHYYARPASQLTPTQSALLASSLPSPLRFNPASPSSFLSERARWNLNQQQKLGGLKWIEELYHD